MSKALLPFYALYVGDGSTTAFVLDISKDPFYFSQGITSFDALEAVPNVANLSPEFDHKSSPTNVWNLDVHKIDHTTNFAVSSSSIDGYQITFNLGSTPGSGVLFAVQGFIEY